MSDIIEWLNKNSPMISALATAVAAITSVVIVCLTRSLSKFSKDQAKWTEASARTTAALKEIEKQRDLAAEPRVFIWFSGYDTHNSIGTLVFQNSGGRSLFLQSLRVEAPGMQVEFFQKEPATEDEEIIDSGGKLVDLVITPQRVERFHFKFKNGSGQHFDLVAQLYVGNPVRVTIDPSQSNGYELQAIGSVELRAHHKGMRSSENLEDQ